MRNLNLGILAHVDAGKTSLTERLLHAAGVIDTPGRVDDGNTQTDTLDLERQRGITIRSAVASFDAGDVRVNLIDTPGHPDFIAEVERVLGVLDGVVLVVSAVEGVQPQARVLFRTLQRLRLPTLLFVNKIDRAGADPARVVEAIAAKLAPAVIAMSAVHDAGTRTASVASFAFDDPAFAAGLCELLAARDDALLEAWVDSRPLAARRLRRALAAQVRQAVVHPVLFGSAMTGAGVAELMAAIPRLLPPADGDPEGPLSATVFKVERAASGEKVAWVRLFSGALRARDRVPFGAGDEAKVTAVDVVVPRGVPHRTTAVAGEIARIRGLAAVRVGDAIGQPRPATSQHFAPPALEAVVAPVRVDDRPALFAALTQLAEQDPLIGLRQDDSTRELFVSLYGEVQKEVIQSMLATGFGLDVEFRETTTICVERPAGAGQAFELIGVRPNPFIATVGLRVEPGEPGSGVVFRIGQDVLGTMPFAFFAATEDTVYETLRQGLHGWQVIDCLVTMTHTGYWPRQSHTHQRFSKSMSSTGADYRALTPLVLMAALREAGTIVEEPLYAVRAEVPAATAAAAAALFARLRGRTLAQTVRGDAAVLEGEVPAASVHSLQQQLPGLTRGEGVLECAFERYEPVRGVPPERRRTDHNPLDRKEYLLHVVRRV